MDQGVTGSPVSGKALGYRNHTSTSGRTGCAPEWEEPNDQPRGCRRASECRSPWAPGRSPEGQGRAGKRFADRGSWSGAAVCDDGPADRSPASAWRPGGGRSRHLCVAGLRGCAGLRRCRASAGGPRRSDRSVRHHGPPADRAFRFGGRRRRFGRPSAFTRAFDVVAAPILRPDERVHRHRVSFAKKAVARLRMSTSSRSLRFSHRNAAGSSRSLLVSHLVHPVDLGLVDPRPNCGLGEIEVLGDLSDPSGHHDGGARRSRP